MKTPDMPDPAVTVVIPTLNRARVLRRALESVLRQSFQDFEVVVVDDGSNDDTPAVVGGFRDARIRFLPLDSNRGASGARNAGIRAARGELVAFLDSDDEWLPTKLERQVARLRETRDPRVGVVYCLCLGYDHWARREVQHRQAIHEGDVLEHLLTGWHPLTASSVVAERAALERAGGFCEALTCSHDYDLLLRLAQASVRFVAVHEALAIKHDNEGPQLSSDLAARLRSERIFGARWGPVVERHLGRAAHRRWRARRRRIVRASLYRGAVRAVAEGQRLDLWKQCAVLLFAAPATMLPLHALALALLGPRMCRAVGARLRAALAGRLLLGR